MINVLCICFNGNLLGPIATGMIKLIGGNEFNVSSACVNPQQTEEQLLNILHEAGITIDASSSETIETVIKNIKTSAFHYVISLDDQITDMHLKPFKLAHKGFKWDIHIPDFDSKDAKTRFYKSVIPFITEKAEEFVVHALDQQLK
jgi:protein-tyrosine-phosphatase